jgi:hypothetical protein
MSSPQEISITHRSTATLTYDKFIRETLLSLGASREAVDTWIPLYDQAHTNLLHKEFLHIGQRLCQQQLLAGKESETLQHVLLRRIEASLAWHKIPEKITLSSTPEKKTVSLLGWCREVLLESATHAFFGDRLLEIEPNLLKIFSIFDASSWKLHYGYPRFLSRELYAARDKIHTALVTYLKLPKEKRPDAAWLIHGFETEMRRLGIEEEDIAAVMVPVYWV